MAAVSYAPVTTGDVVRKPADAVFRRVWELRERHGEDQVARLRIRDICNGGSAGLSALLGDLPKNPDSVPAANLILSGIARVAQQLGQAPATRVDPPTSGRDSQRSHRHAELRERIVASYDAAQVGLASGAPLELQLPQAARWLVGYGFFAWVVRECFDVNGARMPLAELRDPVDTYPGEWGPGQQPGDIMFLRRVRRDTLARLYPSELGSIARLNPAADPYASLVGAPRVASAVSSTGRVSGGWEGTGRQGADFVELAEYHDAWGCCLIAFGGAPDGGLLDAFPTPLRSGPAFVVAKRFAFDRLQGQFDPAVGLLAGMARLNMLTEIAMRDAVFAETIVSGRLDHEWRKGRGAINIVEGGDVKKLVSNLPYQMFTEIDRIERQLRVTTGYSAQSDGESPMSFVTGKGLNELAAGANFEIREYQTVLRHALQTLDAKRLEWDDLAYGDAERAIAGETDGAPYAERYRPSRDIDGNYTTRRAYGAMAGFDDYQKIVAGLQLLGAGIISQQTMRENISGLDNLTREAERIRGEQVESTLMQMLASGAADIDPRVPLTLAALLPEGDVKQMLTKYWTPNEPQPNPAELAALAPPAPAGPALPGAPPDVAEALGLMRQGGGQASALAGLTPSGATRGGVQVQNPL